MIFSKKIFSMIVKSIPFFTIMLFSSYLCADVSNKSENGVAELNKDSINIAQEQCDESNCFFPHKPDAKNYISNKNIHIVGSIEWKENKNLVLLTKKNIFFKKDSKLTINRNASLILKSGMEPEKKPYNNTVIFEGDDIQVDVRGEGKVKIYYNPPLEDKKHKYHNPQIYFYNHHIKTGKDNNDNLSAYMLINDIRDLQDMMTFLSMDYALSQNIDATKTKNWNEGKGFKPVEDESKNMPFSGNFDGNGYTIKNLFINRPDKHYVGLFGKCRGRSSVHNTIENLTLENFNINGNHYVGSLAGSAINSNLLNITVSDPSIKSTDIAGSLVGTTFQVLVEQGQIKGNINVSAEENIGLVIGGAGESKINLYFEKKDKRNIVLKTYKFLGNQDKQTNICLTTYGEDIRACLKHEHYLEFDIGQGEMSQRIHTPDAIDVINTIIAFENISKYCRSHEHKTNKK